MIDQSFLYNYDKSEGLGQFTSLQRVMFSHYHTKESNKVTQNKFWLVVITWNPDKLL